jgi:ketosteroid isomerase-like protein
MSPLAAVMRLPPGRLRRALLERGFRRGFQALNRGKVRAAFAGVHPQAEWHQPLTFPDAGVLRGREEIVAWYTRLLEESDDFRLDLQELIDAGDGQVVVRSTARGRGPTSGITSELEMTELYEIQNGLIVRAREFVDSSRALEAARQAA